MAGSLEWIWSHQAYLPFKLSADSMILHILGAQGSGKSVLAKHIYKRFSAELGNSAAEEAGVLLYYYCNKHNEDTASSVLRGIIHQLAQKSKIKKDLLTEGTKMKTIFSRRAPTWSLEALWSIFRTLLLGSQVPIAYCVIDGVDQCDKDSVTELISLFLELANQWKSEVKVKLLLTSRVQINLKDSSDRKSTRLNSSHSS